MCRNLRFLGGARLDVSQGPTQTEAWDRFYRQQGSSAWDPNRHSPATLHAFLDGLRSEPNPTVAAPLTDTAPRHPDRRSALEGTFDLLFAQRSSPPGPTE